MPRSSVTPENFQDRLLGEQISLVLETTPMGVAVGLAVGALTVSLFSSHFTWPLLLGWYAALAAVQGLRILVFLRWRMRLFDRDLSVAAHWVRIGATGVGLLWGAFAWLIVPIPSPLYTSYIVLVIVGIGVGAVSGFSPLPRAVALYILPMFSLLSLRLLLVGDAVHVVMGTSAMLLCALLVVGAARNTRMIAGHFQARMASELMEQRAIDGEKKYRILIEQAADPVFLHNIEGRLLDVNAQACTALGYEREELLKRNVAEFEVGASPDYLRAHWRSLIAGERCVAIGRHRAKNGREFPVEVVLGTVELKGEICILALVRDITERQRVEAELRLREAQARAQYRGIPLPTYTWQYQSGEFVLVDLNDAAKDYLQGRGAAVLGKTARALYGEQREIEELFVECFTQQKSVQREVRYHFSTIGKSAFLNLRFAFVPPNYVIAHAEDITERKRMEQVLYDSRSKLEYAQRIAKLGHWSWELASGTVEWSDETFRILELDPLSDQPTLDAFSRAMHPDDLRLMEESYARGLAGEREFDDEWRMVGAVTRSVKYVQLRGERFFNNGILTGMKGTLQDVTERKQAELAKSEFISAVSHELRTPLTSIYGALKLLDNGVGLANPDQLHGMIDIALRNSSHLNHLVNDILDFSRIEQGKFSVRLEPVDLTDVVRQAVELNMSYARHFGVELRNGALGQNIVVRGDAARLSQVLNNLLSNAVKYSAAGGMVEIDVSRVGQEACVVVADRGSGIPAEFEPRMFSRFARADNSTTRSKGGTGLGLSIAKAIVDAHHGSIGYRSRGGGGSVFYFTIPHEPVKSVADTRPDDLQTIA